jgi:DNA-binding transcriptional regulator GbsR (MarR family)
VSSAGPIPVVRVLQKQAFHMNAIDLRLFQQAPASGVHHRDGCRSTEVRQRFVDNWGRLAATFGMGGDLGRVHAQLFIENSAMDVAALGAALNLEPEEVRRHLNALLGWGVVRVVPGGYGESYATARDPWEFFLEIVRQRHRREFMPILELVRETASLARQLGGTNDSDGTRARVQQFSKFVEDLSALIEIFVKVGSKPMALALKTFARMAPRA